MRKIWSGILALILLFTAAFAVGIGPTVKMADAFPSFPSAWSAVYPTSSSLSNANRCNLCHQNASGGDGWNAYGWAVRQQIVDQGLSIEDALNAVASLNSDGIGESNLNEIAGNAQPGWTAGSTNTIYFKDGTTLTGQSAPASISGALNAGTSTVPNPTTTEVRLAIIYR